MPTSFAICAIGFSLPGQLDCSTAELRTLRCRHAESSRATMVASLRVSGYRAHFTRPPGTNHPPRESTHDTNVVCSYI